MRRLTVRAQILVLVLAVVLLVACSLVWLTIHQIESQLRNGLEEKAASVCAIVAENAGPGLEFEDTAFVREIINGAFLDHDVIEIHVMDRQGREMYCRVGPQGRNAQPVHMASADTTSARRFTDRYVVRQPILARGKRVGMIQLTVSYDSLQQRIRSSVAVILAVAAGLLAFVFGASSFLARRIVSPITTFEAAAIRIQSGDMVSPIDIPRTHRDFIPLGKAFNEMQRSLRLAFAEITAAREGLEEQVAARTGELQNELAERRRTEVALRTSEDKYRTLFNSANDAIFIMHADRFIDCNHQTLKMFGCTREQIIGQPPYRFSPPTQPDGRDSKEKALEKISGALAGVPQFFEWMHSRDDGSLFDVEVGLNKMTLSGEEIILAIVRDITMRKQAEAQKQKLQEQLDRARRMESVAILAGGVAHDLNNMLGPLVGYPELLLHKIPEDSPLRKPIKIMGKAAKEAADVIQDLLTLARRGRYEMVPISINEIIESYLESPSFLDAAQAHPNVEVTLDLALALPLVLGSSTHLTKALMNLIINAFDATPDGGTLAIRTEQMCIDQLLGGHDKIEAGEYVLLRVKDTGTGIAPEDLPRIFEPYYSKKKMGRSGTGLGLSVVYGIVRDHKGYYDVFSTVGAGTEFIFYFPVTTQPAPADTAAEQWFGGSESILVVDDVEEQREIAAALLGDLGYRVRAVDSGRKAVEYVRGNPVDLVVLDMIMEDGYDGLSAYQELVRMHPQQKAIIISGYAATERVDLMRKLGAGAYVRKPFTRETIGKAVREELDRVPVAM